MRHRERPHLQREEDRVAGFGCAATAPPAPAARRPTRPRSRRGRDPEAAAHERHRDRGGERRRRRRPRTPQRGRGGARYGAAQGAASIRVGSTTHGAFRGRRGRVTGAAGSSAPRAALAAEGAGRRIDARPRAAPARRPIRAVDVTDGRRGRASAGRPRRPHAALVHEGARWRLRARQRRRHSDAARRRAAAGAERSSRSARWSSTATRTPPSRRRGGSRRRHPLIDTKSASDRLAAAAARRDPARRRLRAGLGPLDRPPAGAGGRGGSPSLPGDGVMLPVYVDDLVEAILRGRSRRAGPPTPPGRTPVTFGEYFARIAEIAGAPPPASRPCWARRHRGRARAAAAARVRRGRHVRRPARQRRPSGSSAKLGWEPAGRGSTRVCAARGWAEAGREAAGGIAAPIRMRALAS